MKTMTYGKKAADTLLICGLGNAEQKYHATRHNVGFLALDELAADLDVRAFSKQAGCLVARTSFVTQSGGELTLYLAKPQDFMNTCGGPISKLMRELHVMPQQLLVFHDELDLPAGEVRFKDGGGLNAHNGLRSISNKLQTRDFKRIRCGIGRPPGAMDVAKFVLYPLHGNAFEELKICADDAARLCKSCIADGTFAP